MPDFLQLDICRRIAEVRRNHAGERGKARFARELGISPSTYDYYEHRRVPPASILVAIAERTGVDLRWLLTGQEPASVEAEPSHPEHRDILRRAADLLDAHPPAVKPLGAFLDLLDAALTLPRANDQPDPHASAPDSPDTSSPGQPDATLPTEAERWIPILGRSAAGLPGYWSDPSQSAGLTTLADRIRQFAGQPGRRETTPGRLQPTGREKLGPRTVQVVTLRVPLTEGGPVEFIDAQAVRHMFPDAFAVRVDGESMTPQYQPGDLLLLSPSEQARPGLPAVVQLRNAVGVTCKRYQPEGQTVRLLANNHQTPEQTVLADDVLWALRVLGCVRT